MTIFRYALKRSFGNKTNMIFLGLFPIACLFLPSGQNGVLFPYGYQYFGILLLFVGIRLASQVLEDRAQGVVKRLAVAPVSHLRYWSQNLMAFFLIMGVQCAIAVYGGVLYGHELYRPLPLLLLYVSFSLTSLAIALAWISLYRVKETSFLVYMALIFLIVVMGGLLIPLEIFPESLKRIAVILPTYWLVQGQTWVASGERVADFLLINAVLWLYAVIFAIIGSARKMH
ncbi:ABC transporter permease [Cohnella hongkongensis]|uniref:ABC transporter permease n=1 Tax=Cohnella hongkongensis TaxID=178337 RepID=A0ABV9F5B7_9BACL